MAALPTGSTIGILGGGQLGRMLAIAAAELGYRVHIYTPEADAPAMEVAAEATVAPYHDRAALMLFAAAVDVITLEFENVPVASVDILAEYKPVHPGARVLGVCQHRLKEKKAAIALGIGTAPFRSVRETKDLDAALGALGLPVVLKTCTQGYDGKGQAVIRKAGDADAAFAALKTDDAILEGYVDFAMEISVIVARGANGEVACFPPVQNVHKNHILHQTIAPAPIAMATAQRAVEIAGRLADSLGVVGLLAVEMFVTRDGDVLVNEMAPRPHNSGHWTIDACVTSQFEQAIRAVAGLPLGAVTPLCGAVMTNLIGNDVHNCLDLLQEPRVKLHLYGKKEARDGRKMGHVTVLQ